MCDRVSVFVSEMANGRRLFDDQRTGSRFRSGCESQLRYRLDSEVDGVEVRSMTYEKNLNPTSCPLPHRRSKFFWTPNTGSQFRGFAGIQNASGDPSRCKFYTYSFGTSGPGGKARLMAASSSTTTIDMARCTAFSYFVVASLHS